MATFIENITTSDANFAPDLINYFPLPDIKFNGLDGIRFVSRSDISFTYGSMGRNVIIFGVDMS